TGFAGLAAAIEAYNAGAQVLVLEKMEVPGGNSAINGGVYAAWDSRIRRKFPDLPPDSADIMMEDMLRAGQRLNWPALVKKVATESVDGIEWLLDLGTPFQEKIVQAGGHSRPRTHTTVNASGSDAIKAMLKKAEELKIEILYEHRVTRLIREGCGTGRVLGVEVETGGQKKYFKAKKAVVIATGGFCRNVELRTKFVPWLTAEYPSTNHPGATGEVMVEAMRIGAAATQLDWIQLYPFADPNTGILDRPAVIPFNAPAYCIYVAKNGKRFVNELADRKVCADAQLFGVKEKPTFTIFDDSKVDEFFNREHIEDGIQKGRIIRADTLEELAQKAGIDPAGLKETVAKYNEMVDKGVDEEFGKPSMKAKIEKPPFYAIPQWPSVHHCMGGLQITDKAQVLDLDGNVIPGLYAAGEVTGGVHGAVRLGSCAFVDCIVMGRTAGKNAAETPAA
ncbi:MAG: FAD-dependent oxidoreductase, partial [Anaerolineae bacterium]